MILLEILWDSDSCGARFFSGAPHNVSLFKTNMNDLSMNLYSPEKQINREEKIAVYTIPAYFNLN